MKLKITALFLAVVLLAPFICADVGVAQVALNEVFELPSSAWEGGIISAEAAYSGGAGCAVRNPGVVLDGVSVHHLDYKNELNFAQGEVYKVSLWVRAAAGTAEPFSSKALALAASNTVNFEIKGATPDWQRAEALFIIPKSGVYAFRISLYGAEDSLFYIDDVKIEKTGANVYQSRIDGRQNVLIPDRGVAEYGYALVALDKTGNVIEGVTGEISAVGDMPSGVSFDNGVLKVSSEVIPGAMLRLRGEAMGAAPSAEIFVYFDKNHIVNGGFEDTPLYSGWQKGAFEIAGASGKRYASMSLVSEDDNLWVSKISAENPITLFGGRMYVLRAKVRSTAEFPTRDIAVSSNVFEFNSTIRFTISNIGGEDWTEIVSAIRTTADGNYDLQLVITSPDNRPIHIDDISLTEEELKPAIVSVRAPGHVTVPGSELSLPAQFAVRNQEGALMEDEAVTAEIQPAGRGISFDEATGRIKISPSVVRGTYKLVAASATEPDVQGFQNIIVSDETVGDGGFETKAPGYMWATGSPSVFNIVESRGNIIPPEGKKMGRLALNGSVSALLNDSYRRYEEGNYYIFEGKFLKLRPDVDTTVTIILQNTEGESFEDNVIAAQITLGEGWQPVRVAFTVPFALTARLMIAFNTPEEHTEQEVYFDDIKIPRAVVSVRNVSISGAPYVDRTITGRYVFESNFGAVDASRIVWLISPQENGAYLPIIGQNGKTLELTSDMLGKYIRLEVTPISLGEGIVGEKVLSAPVRVTNPPPPGSGGTSDTEPKPTSPPIIIIPPQEGKGIKPVRLSNVAPQYGFADMSGHWAEGDVALMAGAGIVEGRGAGLFWPRDEVTRAEFSAFIIRSLGLLPGKYMGLFSDVSYGDWFADTVQTVVDFEIAKGVGEGYFMPNAPITREQIAIMCVRAAEKAGMSFDASRGHKFHDENEISPWAKEAVSKASSAGIILGNEKGNFEPQRNATRAEAVAIIKRMLVLLETT